MLNVKGERHPYFMTAVLWYDKNLVSLLSTRHDDTEILYNMKKKGTKDAVVTKQPKLRQFYCDHKVAFCPRHSPALLHSFTQQPPPCEVGVDVMDQRNANLANDHSSKLTPWHRVHDFFINMAFTMAYEHFKVVITAKGTPTQQDHLKKLINKSDEARWLLLEQLTENAKFGELPEALKHLAPKSIEIATPVPMLPVNRMCFAPMASSIHSSSASSSKGSSRPASGLSRASPCASSISSGRRPNLIEMSRLSLCEIGLTSKSDRGSCALEGCSMRGVKFGCQTCRVRLCFGCFKLHKLPEHSLKTYVMRDFDNWVA